jgi:lysophospholipase L1-like esterase
MDLRHDDAEIFFFDGADLLGRDFDECTVDGVHPTDLGFQRIAAGLEPVFRTILGIRV